MQVIAVQTDIVWEDKAANHAKVRSLLRGVTIEPDALIVLPEMFDTGFTMNVAGCADNDEALSQTFLSQLARETGATVIGGVIRNCGDGKGVNESVAYGPDGSEVARYVKIQPFAVGHENDHYHAGDAPVTFSWRGSTVAMYVCYDLRFPEVFRPAARLGAEIITVIANWPTPRIEHWRTLLRARAIENQAYVIGVNRCGVDPKLEYNGQSLIVDPHGKIVADAGDGERVIMAQLDIDDLRDYRGWFHVLKDMRDDFVASPGAAQAR